MVRVQEVGIKVCQRGVTCKYRSDKSVHVQSKETESLHSAWKTFTLRQDFFPCSKLQTEDDITASVVVPTDKLKNTFFREQRKSFKFSQVMQR